MTTRSAAATSPCPRPRLPQVSGPFRSCPKCGRHWSRKHQQQELELVCEYEIDGISDFVFLNRFGQPQNPQTVNRAIKRISVAYNEAELEKAEKEKREPQLLPPFSCHNLRHTFCTRLCENETNLKIIQDIMGHKDISTTMEIYAEATKEAKAHSFANLNGKLGISV